MTLWSDGVHVRIAAAIKTARGKRSAQWLADRTAELGHPITRAQIANYESGRKKTLDIADLIVLAAALNTSPTRLVYPGPYDAEVELIPGVNDIELAAAEWFSGIEYPESMFGRVRMDDDPTPLPPFDGQDWQEWEDNMAFLQLSRVLAELQQMRSDFLSDHDPKLGQEWVLKRLESIEEQMKLVKAQLRDRAAHGA